MKRPLKAPSPALALGGISASHDVQSSGNIYVQLGEAD
jgi:hypothetical protein